MKRTLIAMSALLAVSAMAFQHPAHEPLPNFDRRTDHAGAVPTRIAPQHEQAVTDLKARVSQLEVTDSKVVGHPNFFSSPDGFLTGPNAEGLGVLPASAQAIPANDRHRAIKAFLN